MALIAGVELPNFDLFLCTEGSFFQRDLHIVTQIRAALPLVSATAAAAAHEKTHEYTAAAAAERPEENVERMLESATNLLAAMHEGAILLHVCRRQVWRITCPSGMSSLGSWPIASCRLGSNCFPKASIGSNPFSVRKSVSCFSTMLMPE